MKSVTRNSQAPHMRASRRELRIHLDQPDGREVVLAEDVMGEAPPSQTRDQHTALPPPLLLAAMAAAAAALVDLEPGGATDAQRLSLVGAHWGGQLTAAQYAARDAYVATHCAWVRDGHAQTIHALMAGAAEPHAIDASCETYRMRALCCEAPGVATPCTVLGIASVFTPPDRRGKRNASRLLAALAAKTAAAEQGVRALMLMCEIRPDIYARAGYVSPQQAPPSDWALTVSSAPPNEQVCVDLQPEATPLLSSDMATVAAQIAALAERDLLQRGVGAITVVPTAEQLLWHVARYDARRQLLPGIGLPPPPACGARCGDAFAVWAMDMEDFAGGEHQPVLRVLAFCAAADAEATAAVLAAAASASLGAGAPCGRTLSWDTGTLYAGDAAAAAAALWVPPAEELARRGVSCAREARRCESVPMLAPVNSSVQPSSWQWVPRGVWV
jgi:hypothetical protein